MSKQEEENFDEALKRLESIVQQLEQEARV